jgi:hypothetical protein
VDGLASPIRQLRWSPVGGAEDQLGQGGEVSKWCHVRGAGKTCRLARGRRLARADVAAVSPQGRCDASGGIRI